MTKCFQLDAISKGGEAVRLLRWRPTEAQLALTDLLQQGCKHINIAIARHPFPIPVCLGEHRDSVSQLLDAIDRGELAGTALRKFLSGLRGSGYAREEEGLVLDFIERATCLEDLRVREVLCG